MDNAIMGEKQNLHKITVGIPQDLWESVKELAGDHQRSFVKELVWALHEYVRLERQKKGSSRQ
ncbi:MAG: hypothetical protein ACLQUY_12790 [Ktedonobacterales bacterium]